MSGLGILIGHDSHELVAVCRFWYGPGMSIALNSSGLLAENGFRCRICVFALGCMCTYAIGHGCEKRNWSCEVSVLYVALCRTCCVRESVWLVMCSCTSMKGVSVAIEERLYVLLHR